MSASSTAMQKVVSVSTIHFENVTRSTDNITIRYMQEHSYVLACGHKPREVVSVGNRPKSRMKCKTCAKAVAA